MTPAVPSRGPSLGPEALRSRGYGKVPEPGWLYSQGRTREERLHREGRQRNVELDEARPRHAGGCPRHKHRPRVLSCRHAALRHGHKWDLKLLGALSMSSKRFDISVESRFESRDGGITKGGLVKNGFSEVDGAGERWANMRPALATGVTAGIPGGLGLFLVGSTLYGMGTSGSWQVVLGATPFTLDAQDAGGGVFEFRRGVDGTLTPSTWSGKAVDVLGAQFFGGTGNFFLEVPGTLSQSIWGTIVMNGSPFRTSTATFTVSGGVTSWRWDTAPFSTVGTYAGSFK